MALDTRIRFLNKHDTKNNQFRRRCTAMTAELKKSKRLVLR